MELRIASVGTRLGGRWVLDGVDATPPPGALTGLLGPNGAGKSTLLRTIAGLLRPEAGAVLVGERAVHEIPRRERARHIALLEQENATVTDLTAAEVVALGRIPHRRWGGPPAGADPVGDALAAVGASALANRMWSTLSGGEKQRVTIARALAQEPRLLLLDEPTNHLDISAQLTLLSFVRRLVHEEGRTAVAALHDLNLAATYCDHVLVLHQGRLAAAGTPAEVLTPGLLRREYGVEAEVLTHRGRIHIAFEGAHLPEAVS